MRLFQALGFLGLLLVSPRAVAVEQKTITIGLIGDSTVATTYGWGPAFAERCNDRTRVFNFARNGATLESLSQRLDELLGRKPDYVMIQFGHNDMKQYGLDAYSAKLKAYVDKVKRSGAKAIVLSSVTRRNFDKEGRISPQIIDGRTLADYTGAARAVAGEEGVLFIDLYSISIAHHNKIGPEASAGYDFQKTDKTHFSKKGAAAVAGLIVAQLETIAPELAPYLREPGT